MKTTFSLKFLANSNLSIRRSRVTKRTGEKKWKTKCKHITIKCVTKNWKLEIEKNINSANLKSYMIFISLNFFPINVPKKLKCNKIEKELKCNKMKCNKKHTSCNTSNQHESGWRCHPDCRDEPLTDPPSPDEAPSRKIDWMKSTLTAAMVDVLFVCLRRMTLE